LKKLKEQEIYFKQARKD